MGNIFSSKVFLLLILREVIDKLPYGQNLFCIMYGDLICSGLHIKCRIQNRKYKENIQRAPYSFWDTLSFLKLFCPEFGIFMKIDFQFYRNEICLTALFTNSCKSFETSAAIFEVIERYCNICKIWSYWSLLQYFFHFHHCGLPLMIQRQLRKLI